jgi:hypothetical protein
LKIKIEQLKQILIIYLVIGIVPSNILFAQSNFVKKHPIEIAITNQFYSPRSYFRTLPNSRIGEFPIIRSGFSSEFEFYSPGLRINIYNSLEKNSYLSLGIRNMAFPSWFKQAVIWDTVDRTGRGSSASMGPITYPINFSYYRQINCNKRSKLMLGIGAGIILNSFGSNSPISYVHSDNYHTISYYFENYSQRRLGYFGLSELNFERQFKKMALGLTVFAQVGIKEFSSYRLRAKFNSDYWDGTINSKGDAIGVTAYIRILDFSRLLKNNN